MRPHRCLILGVSLVVTGCVGPGGSVPPTPGPDDIPQPVPLALSLAGSDRPDISRFLNVRYATGPSPLLNWKDATGPSPSPDGSRIAFSTKISGAPQLWVVAATGGWPRQLTFGEPVTFHEWSPTGEWILYGTDRGGDEREGYYLIAPDGTTERELMAPSDAFRQFGGFTRDGKQIAYATTERNGIDFDIHAVDLATGRGRELFRGRMGLYPVSWSPNGKLMILTESRGEDAKDVFLLDVDAGRTTTLFRPEIASDYFDFSWKPDGSGFYFATDHGRDRKAMAFYDLGSRELTWVETPEGDVEQVALSDDGRYLAWTTNIAGYSELRVRDLERGVDLPPPDVPRGIYELNWASQSPVTTIAVAGPQIPGDVWSWNAATGVTARATRSAAAGLDLSAMVVPEHHSFPARDGVLLHGLLYLPQETEGKPPVLLAVHGGPVMQARPYFRAEYQYLLTRGIAVFDLNFRGSTGYGKAFARLDDGRLRENQIHDLADALDWLGEQGQVDASRAAVMGHSYGGYLTMAGLALLPDRFKSGVAFVGVANWISALEGASPELKASDRFEYGDIDDPDDREFFRRISPLTHVANVVAPVMVLHGANDPRDPPTESDQFVRAIREQGGEVEYLRFPDEGHSIRKLSNQIIAYRRVAAFLERTLSVELGPRDQR